VKIPILELDVEMECSKCGMVLCFTYRFDKHTFVVRPCRNCLLIQEDDNARKVKSQRISGDKKKVR
jgi:hypothetical protein